MKYPYLLLSDTHYHAWDAFSSLEHNGVNSRLSTLLHETERAFIALQAAGGHLVVHAGDMFHTRGSLTPSVLNPVRKTYSSWAAGSGTNLSIKVIAGNHDLESNETHWLTAAVSAMQSDGIFFSESTSIVEDGVILVNWHPTVALLKTELERLRDTIPSHHEYDLIIHAPVDDVLHGIPSHGLTAKYLAALDFKRVFSGHYHNHKDFDNDVYSIGALTHQTWSDVGTKAGYCLVYRDKVEWFQSHAPQFVALEPDALDVMDVEQLMNAVDGNYVRMTLTDPTAEREGEARKQLEGYGAKGVLIRSPKAVSTMTGKREVTVSAVDTIYDTVNKYAMTKGGEELAKLCDKIMRDIV